MGLCSGGASVSFCCAAHYDGSHESESKNAWFRVGHASRSRQHAGKKIKWTKGGGEKKKANMLDCLLCRVLCISKVGWQGTVAGMRHSNLFTQTHCHATCAKSCVRVLLTCENVSPFLVATGVENPRIFFLLGKRTSPDLKKKKKKREQTNSSW